MISFTPTLNLKPSRIIAVIVGLTLLGGAFYLTYQYFSTQSRADAPIVKYTLTASNCTTTEGATTCTVNGKQGDIIPVDVTFTAQGENRMSAADLIFSFNSGLDGVLSYQGSTDVGFGTKAIEEQHKRDPMGRFLHLTLLADKPDNKLPLSTVLRLNFKVEKPGTSRIILITSASTIVGPQGNDLPYQILPQNGIMQGNLTTDEMLGKTYNIKVVSNDPNANTPAPTSGTTGTPPTQTAPGGPGNDDDNDEDTSENLPINRKDITVNFRIKFQGITSQPKNSSPIDVRMKLVEERTVPTAYETVSFTPQGDGTYVADKTFKQVNVNGRHSFLIKGPKHIQKRLCDNSPTEQVSGTYKCETSKIRFQEGNNTLNLNSVILLSGDLPLQNGIVDAVDIAYVRNSVGKSDADVVARADLNYDGIVDTQDYTLIINALAFKYDE